MKYRKKPVEVEAVRWEPDDFGRNRNTWGWWPEARKWKVSAVDLTLFIPTLEGEMQARPGDWIIREIKGEFYPCKPDIFAATYEPVPPQGVQDGKGGA
jgi:hypothetical protein